MREKNADTRTVQKKSKRKNFFMRLSLFKRFLMIYCGILAVGIIIGLFMLYGLLRDYEAGLPQNTMDEILEEFQADRIDKLLDESGLTLNEFESNEVVAAYLKEKIASNEISYRKKSGEYSEETPVYVIYAGKSPLARVELVEKRKNAHHFTEWKLGSIQLDEYMKGKTVSVTVPKGSVVTLNGIELSDSYISENDVEFTPCTNVSDYVEKPVNTVYQIENLISDPVIVVNRNGQELELSVEGHDITALYPGDEALYAELEQHIKDFGRSYGRYLINRGSLSNLQSYMVGIARESVADIPAVWAFLYGMTYSYDFQNEKVSNFIKYSEDCFSCDISFDLYVNWGSGSKTYETGLLCTYVKTDGKWMLADFAIN